MKTKIIYPDIQINDAPLEELIWNATEKPQILLDDISEKRWRIIFVCLYGLKMTSKNIGYNYSNNGDFSNCYYYDEEAHDVIFHNHILEVQDSKWIESLKCNEGIGNCDGDILKELKHFIIPLEDYELEVLARELKVEENG